MVLYGVEFLVLCRRVQSEGKYVRRVDVVGNSGYRVRASDILPVGKVPVHVPRRRATKRCGLELAQLWFDVMKGAA
jgi:hypothetical protein